MASPRGSSTRGEAFLTEPPAFVDHESDRREALSARLEADYEVTMGAPRDNARKVSDVADQLSEKMRGLLDKERQEFTAAYRAHTRRVQEDLARLRQRVAEEEDAIHRDAKVRLLKSERDNFRTEALALDTGNAALTKRLEEV